MDTETKELQKIDNKPSITAFCVRERKVQQMINPVITKSKGNRKMVQGLCSVCNNAGKPIKMNKFVSESFTLPNDLT